MLKVVIVDDEPIIRKGIINKLHKLFPNQITILAEASSVTEAKIILKATSPDLVFLDIQLSDGVSFDIFDENTTYDFEIIFITAYNQYAINAIKLGALDYLLKPIEDAELEAGVQKYLATHFQKTRVRERVDVTRHQMGESPDEKLVIRTNSEYHLVYFDNIMYCESDAGYTTFFLKNGEKILVSKSIKEYESLLPKDKFLRTHQSYLVNVAEVSKYDKEGFLILHSQHKIPVSTRKKEEILTKLFS